MSAKLFHRSRYLNDSVLMSQSLEDGPESNMPVAVMERLLWRENAIKVWREYKHITQQELAIRAGITKSYLEILESDEKYGSPEVWYAIAKTLGISVNNFTP